MLKKISLLMLSCLLQLSAFSHNKTLFPNHSFDHGYTTKNSAFGNNGRLNTPPSIFDFAKVNENFTPRHGFGINGGWGAPYGFGLQYSYLFINHFDANVGLGFSFSGLRTGFGTRYHFKEIGSGPFIGMNYVHTSGLSGLEVNIGNDYAKFRILSDNAVFFRGGYKIESRSFQLLFNAGYGLAFDGKDAVYQTGDTSSKLQKFANLQALGGVEVSLTMLFRIGKSRG
ncbi:MAG: hypothetical protein R2788_12535 [Saprospiraceae bacterium]